MEGQLRDEDEMAPDHVSESPLRLLDITYDLLSTSPSHPNRRSAKRSP
jgi:hypothetical protein